MTRGGPRFIAVVGSRKSGKTRLAAFLVRRLTRRGFRVASIKHVHHRGFTMDTPNKDSWRLTKAGARSVVIVSPGEIAQITKLSTGPEKQRFMLGRDAVIRANPDFVVVEGFASAARGYSHHLRIIVTAKSENDLIESLGRVEGKVAAITGAIAHTTKRKGFRGIPVLRYPRDTERLLRLVSR